MGFCKPQKPKRNCIDLNDSVRRQRQQKSKAAAGGLINLLNIG